MAVNVRNIKMVYAWDGEINIGMKESIVVVAVVVVRRNNLMEHFRRYLHGSSPHMFLPILLAIVWSIFLSLTSIIFPIHILPSPSCVVFLGILSAPLQELLRLSLVFLFLCIIKTKGKKHENQLHCSKKMVQYPHRIYWVKQNIRCLQD